MDPSRLAVRRLWGEMQEVHMGLPSSVNWGFEVVPAGKAPTTYMVDDSEWQIPRLAYQIAAQRVPETGAAAHKWTSDCEIQDVDPGCPGKCGSQRMPHPAIKKLHGCPLDGQLKARRREVQKKQRKKLVNTQW